MQIINAFTQGHKLNLDSVRASSILMQQAGNSAASLLKFKY